VDAVVRNDIMVDKLILKDVQLTVANDDNYFVFEDVVLQVPARDGGSGGSVSGNVFKK
jgi:hypothetical protein